MPIVLFVATAIILAATAPFVVAAAAGSSTALAEIFNIVLQGYIGAVIGVLVGAAIRVTFEF